MVGIGVVVKDVVSSYYYLVVYFFVVNKEYVDVMVKVNKGMCVNFYFVGVYDGMYFFYELFKKIGGDVDGEKLLVVMKGMSWESV